MEKATHGNDNGSGFLEVGANDKHEVVINLPRDMTGHIVFSVEQARSLASSLNSQAFVAEVARRKAADAERIAHLPPVDRSALCTTNGQTPEEVRANQKNETGQHDGYIVLCDAERAKGFVRPYRDQYKHVGPRVCGKSVPQGLGISPLFCLMDPEHAGDCGSVFGPLHKGCGSVTTMGAALSETYARDPQFYSHTFCVRCNGHLPVAEFVWTADGQIVGS